MTEIRQFIHDNNKAARHYFLWRYPHKADDPEYEKWLESQLNMWDRAFYDFFDMENIIIAIQPVLADGEQMWKYRIKGVMYPAEFEHRSHAEKAAFISAFVMLNKQLEK